MKTGGFRGRLFLYIIRNMKMTAEIGGERLEIHIERDGDRLTAIVDGREHVLEVSQPEAGIYLFKKDGRVYEARVGDVSTSGNARKVKIRDNEFDIRITDPRKLRSAGTDHGHADGVAAVKTAMPGKVVRLLLSTGDIVEKGQGIVVVEAMKMQNELKSPKDGTVKEIRINEGQTVSAGDILAVIE